MKENSFKLPKKYIDFKLHFLNGVFVFFFLASLAMASWTSNDDSEKRLNEATEKVVQALQKYRAENKELPRHLNDLVPKYIEKLDFPVFFELWIAYDPDQLLPKQKIPISLLYRPNKPITYGENPQKKIRIIAITSHEDHQGYRIGITEKLKRISIAEQMYQKSLAGNFLDFKNDKNSVKEISIDVE